MKKAKKAILLVLCAALLVGASVAGTLAYLTSKTNTLTNTFTVGNVSITLDEAKTNTSGQKVDKDGQTLTGNEGEVRLDGSEGKTGNSYKLVPGATYTKDPTVHVTANSENSWIFVKVENGISAFEAVSETTEGGYKKIADQITTNGWAKLTSVDGVDNVYYRECTSQNSQSDLKVFGNFRIADDANKKDGWSSISTNTTTVKVTAYAIQKQGFENNVAAAWTAVQQAYKSTNP